MRVQAVESLLDTCPGKPEERFERLHSTRDRLYRALALTTGDPSLAAEAVDEALARAFEKWDKISRYASPEGWVYRVALNWSRSMMRKHRREDLWSNPPDQTVSDRSPDPELRAALGRLPLGLRSVVVARYLLDWSTAETSAAIGIPEATVKTRLRRALAQLAEDLGGEAQ